jgi:ribonucleoside-diphosphate reductase alpha chain
MTGHAYEQSAEIATNIGAFPGYRDARCAHVSKPLAKDNVESMLGVIQQHRDAVEKIQPSREFNYLKDEARKTWNGALAKGRQHGYRNAQVTVLAPTGTIAFLMDCDTTGVEPDIALVKYKLLAGGGMLKIVNRGVPDALRRLGYMQRKSKASSRTSKNSTRLKTSKRTARPLPAASSRSICRCSTARSSRIAASAASIIWRT